MICLKFRNYFLKRKKRENYFSSRIVVEKHELLKSLR